MKSVKARIRHKRNYDKNRHDYDHEGITPLEDGGFVNNTNNISNNFNTLANNFMKDADGYSGKFNK